MPVLDLSGIRAGLSGKAVTLRTSDPSGFQAQQEQAEDLWGITSSSSFDAATLARVQRAIGYQISWQVELGMEPFYLKQISSSQSKQNKTYRDGVPLLSPQASAIFAAIFPSGTGIGEYGDLRSIR